MPKQDPAYFKQYYEQNREHRRALGKAQYAANKEKCAEKNRLRYLKFKEIDKKTRNDYQREYVKNRKKADPLYRVRYNLRNRLKKFFKSTGRKKRTKSSELLGCTLEGLRTYLESKFDSNMSWENYGKYWHVDHIIPLTAAQTEAEMNALFHYTNLQPLEAIANIKKGGVRRPRQ